MYKRLKFYNPPVSPVGCALSEGYIIDCNKDSLGGLSKIRMIAKNDISDITETNGIITGITLKTGKQFFDFQLVKSTSNYANAFTPNVANGTFFYAQALAMVMNKVKAATSATVDKLARASIVALVEDRNGETIMLGRENGLDLSGGSVGSGTAGGDRSGYDLQFSGEESKMSHVDPTIIDALLVPAT